MAFLTTFVVDTPYSQAACCTAFIFKYLFLLVVLRSINMAIIMLYSAIERFVDQAC